MIRKHFILLLRHFWRFRLYSFLNVAGLALAIATCILILLYLRREISYDKHFPKADRIFRIANYSALESRARNWANGAPLMAEEIVKFIPEIEDVTRIRPIEGSVLEFSPDSLTKISHKEAFGFFADSTFFRVFDVEILYGNRVNPLNRPRTIVLTESLARKFFGDADPVGKTLSTQGMSFEITAVCSDLPETQHFSSTYFLDWQTFIDGLTSVGLSDIYYSRGWAGVYTYILLDKDVIAVDLVGKLHDFRVEYFRGWLEEDDLINSGQFVLQPITDIHLKSHLEQEIEANGNITYVLVFSLAALLILIIAGVNYVNLATVNALKRMKEVGIRKVSGARRRQLIYQFLGESFFMAFLSGILSILVMDLLLPFFNRITGIQLNSLDLLSLSNISLLLILVITLGLLSGLYPAIYASRTAPLNALKELKEPGSVANRFRVGLVILQYAVSIFMILATIIMYRQMNFFLGEDLGFNKGNIIALTLRGNAMGLAIENPSLYKEELNKLPFVQGVTMISTLPGDRFSVEGLIPDVPQDEDAGNPSVRFLRVDEDFIPLMGIELAEGRNLKRTVGENSEFLLNESAKVALGLKNPLGINARSMLGTEGEIVGVTRDFHYASLHQMIEPLVLEVNYDPGNRGLFYQYMLIRLSPGDYQAMINGIKNKMEELAEGYVMDFTFLEDNIDKNYQAEKRLKDLLRTFAIFAVFISCLGVFGLSSFSAELKTKQTGIRKAMGASMLRIGILMSQNYLVYVIIALIIALPPATLLMNRWLQNFAYHIQIRVFDFILASLITLIITLLAISYQALRSGLANPVDALRYE